MKNALLISGLMLVLSGCATGGDDGVMDKVLTDFGIREPGEDYERGSDQVMSRLDGVGAQEIKRLNAGARHGEVKFQEDGIRGTFYKEVKVYENYYPLEANAISRNTRGERGYHGFIEYEYRIYQGPRKPTRAEAAAEQASVPTGEEGRQTFRYTFGPGGTWNGAEGEEVRR